MFDLLKNERRRVLIRYLGIEHDVGETVPASRIADHVTARENDTVVTDIDSAKRKSVYVALTRTHLHQLANAGLITYDDGRQEVTLEADFMPLHELLRVLDRDSGR